MESTGIYWKPVYNILEGYIDVIVANAQRIKKAFAPVSPGER
jgi:transposase